jgi:hypothetical protein
MSAPPWTPGPWFRGHAMVGRGADGAGWTVRGPDRIHTTTIGQQITTRTVIAVVQRLPEREANARLIAAAPDLAEALANAIEDLLAMHGARLSEYEGTAEELVGEYRAVLAKAHGQ